MSMEITASNYITAYKRVLELINRFDPEGKDAGLFLLKTNIEANIELQEKVRDFERKHKVQGEAKLPDFFTNMYNMKTSDKDAETVLKYVVDAFHEFFDPELVLNYILGRYPPEPESPNNKGGSAC